MAVLQQIMIWLFAMMLMGFGALLWVFGATLHNSENMLFLGIQISTWIIVTSFSSAILSIVLFYKVGPLWGFLMLAFPVVVFVLGLLISQIS